MFEAFPDTHLVIELKTDGGEAIIQPTIDLIVEYDRSDSVTVASFSEDYLRPVRKQLPGVPTNMPESETYTFYVRHLFGLHPWWTPPGMLFQVADCFDTTVEVSATPSATEPSARQTGPDDQFERNQRAINAFRDRVELPMAYHVAVKPCVEQVRDELEKLHAATDYEAASVEDALRRVGLAEVYARPRAGSIWAEVTVWCSVPHPAPGASSATTARTAPSSSMAA